MGSGGQRLDFCAMACAHISVSTFTAGIVELMEEELKEADHEMVRYRRQARVDGSYPDVGLLAVAT